MALLGFLRPPARFSLSDRRIVTLMALSGFVVAFGGSLITHTLPFVRRSLALTEGQMSFVFATTRFFALAALAFSLYGDRHGRRRPFLLGLVIIPVANLATALAPGTALFVATQSVARIGVIAVVALSVVFLAEELTPGVRSYGIGIYALAGAMGNGASLILLPIADRGADAWRFMFALSALGLFIVPVIYRFLRESRAYRPPEYHLPLSAVVREGHGQYLWTLGAMSFFIAAFASPALDFGLERLINDLEWDTSRARLLIIVVSGLGVTGLLIGGRLADRVGRRPTELFAISLGLAGGLGFYFVESGPLLALSLLIGIFGATALTPAIAAHRSELFPTRLRATAGAWVTNAGIVGSIFGFVVGGFAIDAIGLPSTIAILGVGLLISAALVLPLPETRGWDLTKTGAVKPPAAAPAPPTEP